MIQLKRHLILAAGVAVLLVPACGEDTSVAPPPPPPQIQVTARYGPNPDVIRFPNRGLQSADVFDVLVDSNGKVWFATEAGVSRFNGTTPEAAYNQNTGMPNPKARSLFEFNGKLWVGTWGGGVGVFDLAAGTWSALSTADGLINDLVADIDTSGGRIYFATNAGVSLYTDDDQIPMKQRWSRFGAGQQLLDPVVSTIQVAVTPRDRELWCGPRFESGLTPAEADKHGITVKLDGAATPIYYTPKTSALAEPNVNDIYYDAAADLFWVAFSGSGLASADVDAKTWRYYSRADGLPSEVVYSIAQWNGAIWVATQEGIARQTGGGEFIAYGRSGGLPANRVRRIYVDNGGGMWLGLIAAGAVKVNPASAGR